MTFAAALLFAQIAALPPPTSDPVDPAASSETIPTARPSSSEPARSPFDMGRPGRPDPAALEAIAAREEAKSKAAEPSPSAAWEPFPAFDTGGSEPPAPTTPTPLPTYRGGPTAVMQPLGDAVTYGHGFAEPAAAPQFVINWPRTLALGFAVAAGLAWLNPRGRAILSAFGHSIMLTFRKRAAAAICIGLALIFADWRIFDTVGADPYWQHVHDAGWLALVGAVIALTGLYHWIAGPPPDEI